MGKGRKKKDRDDGRGARFFHCMCDMRKKKIRELEKLPPGQSPLKDISVPQSLTCVHVPCSFCNTPSQRGWGPFLGGGSYRASCASGASLDDGRARLEGLVGACGHGGCQEREKNGEGKLHGFEIWDLGF